MIELNGKSYILFDGDCGICTYSAGIAGRMDRGGNFIIRPYRKFPEAELKKFGIDYEKCSKSMQAITHKGRVYRGAFAVNYFLWHRFPWNLLVFFIYALPPLLLLEVIVYRLVAINRGRISKWFGAKACTIETTNG